jgi:hypothetical protein
MQVQHLVDLIILHLIIIVTLCEDTTDSYGSILAFVDQSRYFFFSK